ncbi:16S rRNA (cytidine(1402)-2'-O)-methyltransferase [Marinobacter sp. SS21]|uniref:16S rRNA (cytidine(1402)-2'-O)-methyltransferase n=1 Tax=Marinobacter sp. SS21 TaxID=2979460 RepID=UPI00232DB32D|nr:16S rRNA (cytidine(1402)-2'-O)-methyltransferase [Marinobacter sp. SS21]MDC0664089.1 16S rRNA (cytidine(1402)-2'-O)-methyltransferase [Marinobacter sp. SS21]
MESTREGSQVGVLYIVATPIGNLDDITERACRVLTEVDVIAAEDTRHSGRLLQHLGIQKPMISLHEHNERNRADALLRRIEAGESAALVSDAGTPLISDPGFVVVREARARGVRVVPVPGACALVAALSAAGLPTDRFLFAGFVPAKSGARRAALQALAQETATLVFYESPHRIRDMIADIAGEMGDNREVVIARELTKTFETFYSGTAAELMAVLADDGNASRGEFVVMVRGAPSRAQQAAGLDVDRMLSLLVAELPVKQAAKIGAELTGLSRNELYQRALAFKSGR